MGSSVVSKLIILFCILCHSAVLEASPPPIEGLPVTEVEPSTTTTSDAANLNEQANYFQEILSATNNTVLETYSNTSPVQCALRCKRNKGCVDVAFKDDKMCLLLGRAVYGNHIEDGSKQMSPVKFPGKVVISVCL